MAPRSTARVELVWEGKGQAGGRGGRADAVEGSGPFSVSDRVLGSSAPIPGEFRNRLVLGDNRALLTDLRREFPGQIDLIYIDPPFNMGTDLSMEVAVGPDMMKIPAYADRWEHGASSYAQMMYERLLLMRDLLSPTGSIYVHCDYRANAILRLILDEVFGPDRLCNEIIWHYQSGGRQRGRLSMKHDTLLLYTRSNRWTFNLKEIAQPRGRVARNHMKRQVGADGRVCFTIKSAGKVYTYYEDELLTPCDVWTDISHIQQKDPQRSGYPTQKPEALLERIIRASSNPDDLVADFFCGSGTTGVVAERLGRRWFLCDQSRPAMAATLNRLLDVQRELLAAGRPARGFDVYGTDGDEQTGGDDLYAELIRRDGRLDVRITGFKPKPAAWRGIFRKPVRGRTASGNLDLIDSWAIDFDWRPDRPFTIHWQTHRRRSARQLVTESDAQHAWAGSSRQLICVKAWDVFGRATILPMEAGGEQLRLFQ